MFNAANWQTRPFVICKGIVLFVQPQLCRPEFSAFVNGWRSRVAADPQFPFKVLMEELVGVSANVLGDMASRPNFGLNELDFVFSTLVVGSIMVHGDVSIGTYSIHTDPNSPFGFANCPPSHMFQSGSYDLLSRLGTFVYKGAQFAAVGFAAGLVGTALSMV
ncbi:Protein RETICULATA-RELATED 3, chloroplastic [Datura stramonium]|uniref:Protein RETICULATA-RELATED 3, chloroplastic n=1 Tax=Datura stramonium TaxID=4076 RepID=A0ABS8RKF2_DATST|nr:Protein RETICULATA-RELATED 3, chloroplastic [Datura stramonium]